VGSRLIYPDGRQQEASGVIFRDSSAWNHGHLNDPYKPQDSYLRQPDDVSGAALAIRPDLFAQLDGFDEQFASAYYEDADLALRVRAGGLGVFYQFLSSFVHFEGASAGADETSASGMKRFQAINCEKLLDRWRDQVVSHGPPGEKMERQTERLVHRDALVVDVYILKPDKGSGHLRMVNLFAILLELGSKVTFAASNLEASERYVAELQRRDIFFIGAFAHPPNTDAVLWFCREIFPRILAREPDIRFSVIGADPPAQVRALASDSVHILGYVPDVSRFFDGCRLSVAPLRYGAGVKGKVNQSLAHGLPVVATSQASEGMFLRDGESVLVTDESKISPMRCCACIGTRPCERGCPRLAWRSWRTTSASRRHAGRWPSSWMPEVSP
jgi:hypothetical protein